VSLRKGLPFDLRYGPKHREGAVLLNRLSDDGLVSGTGYAVQDDAGYIDLRVELETAQDHGSHSTGTLGAVYDKNDRGVKKLRQFRRTGAPFKVNSIVETTIPFDDREVTGSGAAGKGKEDLLGGHQEGVQIMTGMAGR
jgi:hypothetical protein